MILHVSSIQGDEHGSQKITNNKIGDEDHHK